MFPELTELIPTPGSVYVLLLPHLFLRSWFSWSCQSFSSTFFPPFPPPSLPLSLSFHNIYLYLEPFYFFDRLFNICPLQCNVRFCWTRIIPFVLFLVSPEPKQCPEYNTCSVYISWLFTEWSMFCSCPHVLYICTKVLIIFDYWGGMKSWRSLDMVHRAAPQCPCLHRYLTLINIKMISRDKECPQRIS